MKTIAYTALHYGRDYLDAAIRSVIDAVDEYHVLYSPIGSHGHLSDHRCPETESELREIAHNAALGKLRWHFGAWGHEGQQRDSIYQYAPDADVILVLDADEIWHPDLVSAVLSYAGTVQYNPPLHRLRLPMIHFWRSFHRAMLHDPALPERVIFPRIDPKYGAGAAFSHKPPICHMGYAQRSEIVEYKQHVHGHKGEWRRDCDWFHDRFLANAQRDCHPVGSEYWNPEPVKPLDYMPQWMSQHPYFNLEVIP